MLAVMGKVKLTDGRMCLASLILVFVFSSATGRYCMTYFRLLLIAATVLWRSLRLPRYSKTLGLLFMAALWNRVGHYIFVLWFLLLLSFFRLFSAVADWMSTIGPIIAHMMWA